MGNNAIDDEGHEIYETIHDLEEMERLMIERNIAHFGQAQGTTPTAELISILLDDGCNQNCEKVINGEGIDVHTIPQQGLRQIIEFLSNQLPTKQIVSTTLTSDDLKKGFECWRESTTTSPSGIDLGHWQATSYSIRINGEDHNKKTEDILRWHATLINETVRRSHVLERWKTVHSCMIEKTPGLPILHKLRVIHIFEADLNLLLGIWSRRLQRNAESNQLLHKDQWAQKGNRSIDLAMTKKLTYIYSNLTRTDLGTLDTDAKSCYDRMTTDLLVTLGNRQLGMPIVAATKVQTSFLNTAKFHLRTKLGTSKLFYGNSADTPQHGQGQGAKWAPMSLIGISTLLLDITAQSSPHRITISDTKQILLHDTRQMDGYVDDFTSWMNIKTQIHTPYNICDW